MADTSKDIESQVTPENKPKKPKNKAPEAFSVITEPSEPVVPSEEVTAVVTDSQPEIIPVVQELNPEQARRQKLYEEYWNGKVKDPTDIRYPWEYIPNWF